MSQKSFQLEVSTQSLPDDDFRISVCVRHILALDDFGDAVVQVELPTCYHLRDRPRVGENSVTDLYRTHDGDDETVFIHYRFAGIEKVWFTLTASTDSFDESIRSNRYGTVYVYETDHSERFAFVNYTD